MNSKNPGDRESDAVTVPASVEASGLPELDESRIDLIETGLFAEISRERVEARTRRARRGRGWMVAGAAAAVLVVAAVIAPSVGTLVGTTTTNLSADVPAESVEGPAAGVADQSASRSDGLAFTDGGAANESGAVADGDLTGTDGRDIITTASATVLVDDIPEAARTIGDAATAVGGYVESMSVGRSGEVVPVDPATGDSVYDTMPYPSTPDGAWITVRVPSAELDSLVERLSGIGEVTASSVNRQDVTEQTVDLRARVDAAQASVDRMTEIMAQAASLTDLIAAESALAERQTTLESYQQQLKYYDEQVAMSTLTVSITTPVVAVEANPAGFGDGLAAGWNGLVATLNGIVIAIGFLIPWLLVIGVAALVVWVIVRAVRRRRISRDAGHGSARARSESDEPGERVESAGP